MFCTQCGTQLKVNQKFCTTCGSPTDTGDSTRIPTPAAEPPTPVPSVETAASGDSKTGSTLSSRSPRVSQPVQTATSPDSVRRSLAAQPLSPDRTVRVTPPSVQPSVSKPTAVRTSSLSKRSWLGFLVAVVILAALLIPFALWRLRPAPATVTILVDSFSHDQSLNNNLWAVNDGVGTKAGENLAAPPPSIVTPTLAFSPESGLGVAGLATTQAATIQTRAAFVAPFSVRAEVMVQSGDFELILADDSAQQGLAIAGPLNPRSGSKESST